MSYLQSKSGDTPDATTLSITLNDPAALGSVIVVGILLIQTYAGNTLTVTDDGGNSYTQRAFNSGSTGNQSTIVYTCTNTANKALTITVALVSPTKNYNIRMAVLEAGGVVEPPNPIAQGSSDGPGVATTVPGGGVAFPANSYAVAIATEQGFHNNITWNTSSPYQLREQDGNNGPLSIGFGSIGVYDNTFLTDQTTYSFGCSCTEDDASVGAAVVVLLILAPFTPPSPTSDIITDVCERAGLTDAQIDVSRVLISSNFPSLGNVVPGYLVERPTPASTIIKALAESYFFDACESDGTMRFVPRGLPTAMSIPEADLGLFKDKCKIIEHQAQEQDLPKRVTVLYNDPALDYQQGKQQKERTARVLQTRQQKALSFPITMTGTQARKIAEIALYLDWLERSSYTMSLWRAIYMRLDPTDVVQFTYENLVFTMRVVENQLGAEYTVALNGVSEDVRNYISNVLPAISSGFSPTQLRLTANTILFLLDIPLLRDTDSTASGGPRSGLLGYYAGMTSTIPQWPGAVLYDSNDNTSWTQEASDSIQLSFGTAVGVLGAPVRSSWIWDTVNTLKISLTVGTVAGDTDLNVLNGANQLIVGSEIIQFANATLNSDGTYTLSRLLRGRRGTEWANATHVAGESVVVPTDLFHEALPLVDLNKNRYYQAVTVGQVLGTGTVKQLSNTGAELRPYAPCHVTGARDGGGNLTLTWIRRTRIGWASLSQDPVPLSEDSELYSVDILGVGGSVLRTISGVTSPTTTYSAAQQIADFGTEQPAIAVNVYQISGEVGKGFTDTVVV